jgi:hypothetical protein
MGSWVLVPLVVAGCRRVKEMSSRPGVDIQLPSTKTTVRSEIRTPSADMLKSAALANGHEPAALHSAQGAFRDWRYRWFRLSLRLVQPAA